jgi:hypothetical protein
VLDLLTVYLLTVELFLKFLFLSVSSGVILSTFLYCRVAHFIQSSLVKTQSNWSFFSWQHIHEHPQDFEYVITRLHSWDHVRNQCGYTNSYSKWNISLDVSHG